MPGQSLHRIFTLTRSRALMVTLCVLSSACTDIREYVGVWTGNIVSNEYLRHNLDSSTQVTLTIDRIDRGSLEGRISLTPSQTITSGFTDATLIPVSDARNDVLGDLSFDGDPIATYLFFAAPDDPDEEHAMVLISAHSGERMEMRLLRHDLYGVFRLRR